MEKFKVLNVSLDKRSMTKYVECDGKTYDIQVSYRLGGANPFTNRTEDRGIWLSISPVEKNGVWSTYTAFSGTKVILKNLERFSKKWLDAFCDEIFSNLDTHEIVLRVFGDVKRKEAGRE